jgi:DNA (cytosine-5)-methyltransferase 1
MKTMKNGVGEFVVNEIKNDFKNIGYLVENKILPAVNFGVPQKRERLIFLGYRKDLNKKPEFPRETHGDIDALNDNKLPLITVEDAISDLPSLNPGESYENKTYPNNPNNDYQKRLRGTNKILFNHKAPNHSEYMIERIKRVPQGGNHKDLPDKYKLKKGYSNIYGRLSLNKPADTITANCGCVSAPGRFIHPKDNRAITVREAARLQSFRDDFKFFGSINSQYKQVGNAVPPILAENLAKKIYTDLI